MEENKNVLLVENELITLDSIIVKRDAIIEFNNFEEVKNKLTDMISKYNDLVFTDDDIAQAKEIRTELNGYIKLFNSMRIAVKKKVMEPYENLELQVKELEGIINNVKEGIEKSISKTELKRRETKLNEIKKIFNDKLEEYQELKFVKLEMIQRKEWDNVGETISKITKEISAFFEKMSGDMTLINLDENGARIRTIYMNNGFNLPSAKEEVLRAISNELREQERINTSMEDRGINPIKQVVEAQKEVNKVIAEKPVESVTNNKEVISNIKTIRFELEGDKEDLLDILNYMKSKKVIIRPLKEETNGNNN